MSNIFSPGSPKRARWVGGVRYSGWPVGFGRLTTTSFFTTLSTNYRLFDTLSTNFIDFFIFRIFGPDIDSEPELNFHLKNLAHF